MLAAIRPDDQSFALLLHLVGATVVFGALLASATSLLLARGETRLLRLGYFSLLFVGLPGLILLRLAGQWLYQLQNWDKLPPKSSEPTWLSIGFIVADWGGILFLLALALGGIGVYRLRNGKGAPAPQGDDGHLARPHRRLRRRGVGDDRQAELARARREREPMARRTFSMAACRRSGSISPCGRCAGGPTTPSTPGTGEPTGERSRSTGGTVELAAVQAGSSRRATAHGDAHRRPARRAGQKMPPAPRSRACLGPNSTSHPSTASPSATRSCARWPRASAA